MAVYKINSPLCANGITEDRSTAGTAETNDIEKPIRRRQSVERLAYKGKGLPLRPKSGGRADTVNRSCQNFINNRDPSMDDALLAVRKSSSTSNLTDSESCSSSIWPTSMWGLRADVLARPLLDGLQMPISARRSNKAALD